MHNDRGEKNARARAVYATLRVDGGEYVMKYEIPPINTSPTPLPAESVGLADILRATPFPGDAPGVADASVPDAWVPDAESARKMAHVSQPIDQGECGSCWSVVVAQCTFDHVAAASARLNTPPPRRPPSISWSLACFSHTDPCGGGDPATLLRHARTYGIPADTCFQDKKQIPNNKEKPALVCGCHGMQSGALHDVYEVTTDPVCVFLGARAEKNTENGAERVARGISLDSAAGVAAVVQSYVRKNGSMIANLVVLDTFLDGKFCMVNGGVYLERILYGEIRSATDEPKFAPETAGPAGSIAGWHSVCVVGWGVARGVATGPGGARGDVPYWLCRNSWGTHWGEDGYFRLAKYPHNKVCQIEAPVSGGAKEGLFGGTIAFDAIVRRGVRVL